MHIYSKSTKCEKHLSHYIKYYLIVSTNRTLIIFMITVLLSYQQVLLTSYRKIVISSDPSTIIISLHHNSISSNFQFIIKLQVLILLSNLDCQNMKQLKLFTNFSFFVLLFFSLLKH